MSLEAILSKVAVKRECLVEPVMIDQGETGAVDKTKLFVVVPCENRFRGAFDGVANTKDSNSRLIELSHELDRHMVADFETDQGVGFAQDEIRC